MSTTITADGIWTRALEQADMASSTFATSARKLDYVNDALSELYYMLLEADPSYALTVDTSIALVSGTESYNLPATFLKAVEVFVQSGGRRYRIPRYESKDLDGKLTAPTVTGTVELHHIPQWLVVTDSTAVLQAIVHPNWDAFCVQHVAARLLIKEESDASQVIEERERLRALIRSVAGPRDIANADVVTDVNKRWDLYHERTSDFSYRNLRYRIQGTKIYFNEVDWGL